MSYKYHDIIELQKKYIRTNKYVSTLLSNFNT